MALWYAFHKPMGKQVTKRRTAYRIVRVPIGTALLDRGYAEGYRRQPENPTWGKLGAKLLARRLRQDAW